MAGRAVLRRVYCLSPTAPRPAPASGAFKGHQPSFGRSSGAVKLLLEAAREGGGRDSSGVGGEEEDLRGEEDAAEGGRGEEMPRAR